MLGQTVFYSIALYALDDAQNQKAQRGIRQIVSKAEGELSVRQAIEEIVFWLQSEAKIVFEFQQLSRLSQEEVNDFFTGRQIPVHANWKQMLTSLSEKKAIIASIKANPFAQAINDQIRDVEASLEALTRVALVINSVAR